MSEYQYDAFQAIARITGASHIKFSEICGCIWMNDLPEDLQQQVLQFIATLREQHLQNSSNAWDVLESLTGTVEAPADWSTVSPSS